jgi:hypothetical protein
MFQQAVTVGLAPVMPYRDEFLLLGEVNASWDDEEVYHPGTIDGIGDASVIGADYLVGQALRAISG